MLVKLTPDIDVNLSWIAPTFYELNFSQFPFDKRMQTQTVCS